MRAGARWGPGPGREPPLAAGTRGSGQSPIARSAPHLRRVCPWVPAPSPLTARSPPRVGRSLRPGPCAPPPASPWRPVSSAPPSAPRPLPVQGGPSRRPRSLPVPRPIAPPPARPLPVPGGGRSAAGRAGAPRLRAQHPRRRLSGRQRWRRGGGSGAGGGAGSHGRAGDARGALTGGLSPAGGSGCSRGGGASWTCSHPWSCCSGSARPPRSQVRPAGDAKVGAPGPPASGRALCGVRPVPAGRRPPHLQLISASVPDAAPALPTRAGGRRPAGDGVGPGPRVPRAPRRPFILWLRGFVPPRPPRDRGAGWPGGRAGGPRPESLAL